MAQDVRHKNMTDPAAEQAYCHLQGDIVKFDGVHVANVCWGCSYWGGLAGGFGVECVYDDANATQPEVTYTKPVTAMAEAPEAVDDADSISSADGIAARDARIALTPVAADADVPAKEETAEEPVTEQVEEGDQAPAAVPKVSGKNPIPPQFKKKKKVVPTELPPLPTKSMTAVDLIASTIAAIVEEQREVAKSLMDDLVMSRTDAVRVFTDMPELKSWPADEISLSAIVKSRVKKGIVATDRGLIDRCMSTQGAKSSDNPQVYCAAIHKAITGEWPGEQKHLPGRHDQQSHGGREATLADNPAKSFKNPAADGNFKNPAAKSVAKRAREYRAAMGMSSDYHDILRVADRIEHNDTAGFIRAFNDLDTIIQDSIASALPEKLLNETDY